MATMSREERRFFEELHLLLDDIFDAATNDLDMTWQELAELSTLHPLTVDRLGNRVTKRPQFLTVQKLADAVGWKLNLEVISNRQVLTVKKTHPQKMAA